MSAYTVRFGRKSGLYRIVMSYLKERIKHAVRFRHKRGFGVHSPFMFNLILNVIRDKQKQFVYPEVLEEGSGFGHREKKMFRLLSRLSCFLNVGHIACWGADAAKVGNCLKEAVAGASVGINDEWANSQADFFYIGRKAGNFLPSDCLLPEMLSGEHRRVCIVVTDIYKNPFAGRLWRKLGEKATVRVDMMWYGILFFDEKLQKGRYNLII